jgi:hypothetical protein
VTAGGRVDATSPPACSCCAPAPLSPALEKTGSSVGSAGVPELAIAAQPCPDRAAGPSSPPFEAASQAASGGYAGAAATAVSGAPNSTEASCGGDRSVRGVWVLLFHGAACAGRPSARF